MERDIESELLFYNVVNSRLKSITWHLEYSFNKSDFTENKSDIQIDN